MGGRATFYGQSGAKVTFYGEVVNLHNGLIVNELRNILKNDDLRSPFMGKVQWWWLRASWISHFRPKVTFYGGNQAASAVHA